MLSTETVLPLVLEKLWNNMLQIGLLHLIVRAEFTSHQLVRCNRIQRISKATTYIIGICLIGLFTSSK